MERMKITVGHIVDNPNFNCDCCIEIRDGISREVIFYRTDLELDHPIPAEVLVMPVTFITVSNDVLVIDAKTWED